ncbi:hypothetical protein chiPu_0014142 [Chiloscyllium punctatum]|uniref:Uncharacterized protein n=1 Tax=Chiloscyllium punctatum TaxID=137246 RepID=A0A401SZ28_CHIPU|nr:hypothetical protein [Chiloscyllium punctatum]
MKVQAGSCGQDAAGGDVGVGLRRDLKLLRAAGKESPLPSSAGVRQSMKRLSSELQGLYEERLKQLGNKDESKGALKPTSSRQGFYAGPALLALQELRVERMIWKASILHSTEVACPFATQE